jgi:hypothetical protein
MRETMKHGSWSCVIACFVRIVPWQTSHLGTGLTSSSLPSHVWDWRELAYLTLLEDAPLLVLDSQPRS